MERNSADSIRSLVVPGQSCITYRSAAELTDRIKQIDDATYARLQAGALTWLRSETTVAVARDLIESWRAAAGR